MYGLFHTILSLILDQFKKYQNLYMSNCILKTSWFYFNPGLYDLLYLQKIWHKNNNY